MQINTESGNKCLPHPSEWPVPGPPSAQIEEILSCTLQKLLPGLLPCWALSSQCYSPGWPCPVSLGHGGMSDTPSMQHHLAKAVSCHGSLLSSVSCSTWADLSQRSVAVISWWALTKTARTQASSKTCAEKGTLLGELVCWVIWEGYLQHGRQKIQFLFSKQAPVFHIKVCSESPISFHQAWCANTIISPTFIPRMLASPSELTSFFFIVHKLTAPLSQHHSCF